MGYVKRNAVAGHRFESWAAMDAHLERWMREVADLQVHGMTGGAPIERFRREELAALRPLAGRAPFRQLRELVRVVQSVERDANRCSVPRRLIGAPVSVMVGEGEVVVSHSGVEVARQGERRGRRERSLRPGHLDGTVGIGGRALARVPAPEHRIRAPAGRGPMMGDRLTDPLDAMLERLKRSAVRDWLDNLLDDAGLPRMTLRESLALLLHFEIGHREERRIRMAIVIAKFPFVRRLDGFDIAAQPSLDPAQVPDLAASRRVGNGDPQLVLGPPDVGKFHLAVGLDREAIRLGYSVLFVQATAQTTTLARAHAEGRLEDRLAFFARPKLLIVDELGYLPFEPNAGHLFFQLVSRRYERGSLLVTSNRSVGEWSEVFGDLVAATAILDRLLHHSLVVTIRGESYCLRRPTSKPNETPKGPASDDAAGPVPDIVSHLGQ